MSKFRIIGKNSRRNIANELAESAVKRIDKVKRQLDHTDERVKRDIDEMYTVWANDVDDLIARVQKLETEPCISSAPTPVPVHTTQHTTTVVKEQADLSSINVQLQALTDLAESLDIDISLADETAEALKKEIADLKRTLKQGAIAAAVFATIAALGAIAIIL